MTSFETVARPSHATPTPTEVSAVSEIFAREGQVRTQQILGLGRHTVERLRGGLPVHRSTMIACRLALRLHSRPESQP
jgi:hypothetical protein